MPKKDKFKEMNRKDLKEEAKKLLTDNWKVMAIIFAIYLAASSVITIIAGAMKLGSLVTNILVILLIPMLVALYAVSMKVGEGKKPEVKEVFDYYNLNSDGIIIVSQELMKNA